MTTEIAIAVKREDLDDLKPFTVLGIDTRALQIIPKKSKEGFLVKFVFKDGGESPVYRVTTMNKIKR